MLLRLRARRQWKNSSIIQGDNLRSWGSWVLLGICFRSIRYKRAMSNR